MKKSYIALWLLVAIIATLVIAWNLNRISGTWHYKMTVTVETPEGLKTGYAVREVGNSASLVNIGGTPESTPRIYHKGEAVLVDLGERGKLFAILSGYRMGVDYSKRIFYHAFEGGTAFKGVKKLNSLPVGTKVTLKPMDYPMFVMFKDVNDPKSLMRVMNIENKSSGSQKYQITENHMEELFGKGVKLKDVTIEITDEPVTNVIENDLPEFGESFWEWFKSLKYGDPRRVGPSDFN